MIANWIASNCRFAESGIAEMIADSGQLYVVKRQGKSVLVKGLVADQHIAEIAGVKVGDLVFEVVPNTDGRKTG